MAIKIYRSRPLGQANRRIAINATIKAPALRKRKKSTVVVDAPDAKATLPKIAIAPKPVAEKRTNRTPLRRVDAIFFT
jgi:hypothetical protein